MVIQIALDGADEIAASPNAGCRTLNGNIAGQAWLSAALRNVVTRATGAVAMIAGVAYEITAVLNVVPVAKSRSVFGGGTRIAVRPAVKWIVALQATISLFSVSDVAVEIAIIISAGVRAGRIGMIRCGTRRTIRTAVLDFVVHHASPCAVMVSAVALETAIGTVASRVGIALHRAVRTQDAAVGHAVIADTDS